MTTDAVEQALSKVGPDTIAKFLFTSGSTGKPKAVINTQKMICANQVMIRDSLAFLKDEPPVLVDWLPWNHTAGGNHNFGIALFNGGSLYIDDGSPITDRHSQDGAQSSRYRHYALFQRAERLRDAGRASARQQGFARTLLLARSKCCNMPAQALPIMSLRLWKNCAVETIGEKIMIITGYGSTETGPFLATTSWPVGRPGEIGLPVAGSEMKLVPNGEKMEVRVKGASITPGYWRQPEKTAEAFDEEGYYLMQDALKFHDPNDIPRALCLMAG